MLSDSEIAQYHDRGYVFPDFKLPADTLAEIRADHDRLLARYPEFRDNCSDLLGFDTGFLNYARNPEILDMVAQLIGPDIALWNMSFFAKPAVNGKKTPWHQDGAYWPIRPLATCTVWIAVDDATPENGCMRFIPGSHKSKTLAEHAVNNDPDYTLNQELDPATYDPAEAIDVTLEAGQISLHDVYLFHGSEVNRSPHPRRGMTLRLMPTSSVYDRAMAAEIHATKGGYNQAKRTIFLMRGTDRSGANDFRVQRAV